MKTKIGTGWSNQTNSREAGIEAATIAIKNGGIARPDFALVFCSGKHNPYEFLEGVNSILKETPKIGGSAIGIITDEFIGYDGFEVGVTVFSSDKIIFKTFAQSDINKNEFIAGSELGMQIQNVITEVSKGLLVFYDSSKQQNPPMLNFATPLFEGIEQYIPEYISIAGGGFLADMQLNTCYQFYNNTVLTQHAVAVLISGECTMQTTIMHGCKPCSAYLTITKTHGSIIYEIDNKPALEVIDELLGNSQKIKWKDFALYVTLGVNHGDKFGLFDEKEYANRLTLAVDEENKALIMFEPDLKVGDEVQLMRRSIDLNYIETTVSELKATMQERIPIFSFYINCAGRAKPYSGTDFEDAEEVQRVIGSNIPLMGFYSGVEVAKVGTKLQALDWTGVLCIIGEE